VASIVQEACEIADARRRIRMLGAEYLLANRQEKIAKAASIAIEIVRKSPDQVGFSIQSRRWVVERFFAWIGRNRRLAKDFEASIESVRAFLYAASIMLLVRRLARVS
jgi:hypothetical protein